MRVGGWMNELLLRSLWTEEDWGSSRKARVGGGGKRLLSSLLRRRSQTASRSISTDGRRRRQFGFVPSRRRVAGVAGFDGVAVLEEEAAALVAAVAVQEEDRPRVAKKENHDIETDLSSE